MEKSKGHSVQNQVNTFQWNCINGFRENGVWVRIVNCLPVGAYPKYYSDLLLKDKSWIDHGIRNQQIGGINLPFFKQISRTSKLKSELKNNEEKEILIYSTYLPFLYAVRNLDKKYHVTLIVTDLPDFYDLGKINYVKRILRTINNWLVYRCLERIDSFVLLTEQMKEPLRVGKRPYVVVEGLCSTDIPERIVPNKGDKKIIFYSGTLHYKYGIRNLLAAFSMLDTPDAELWICGSGEAEKEIKERSQKDENIRFFGFCSGERVAELRSQATVLVNPRTNEGEYTKYSFPSKTMEYMASGIPVVMYKLDGIPNEYVPYLYFVEGTGTEALKDTLENILKKNEDELIAFGQSARAFVLKEKNAVRQTRKIIDGFSFQKAIHEGDK